MVSTWWRKALESHAITSIWPHVPAFMIAISIPPSSDRTRSAVATIDSRRLTSTGATSIRSPATSRSLSSRRALIATRAPRSASSVASAAPMPLEPPVIQIRCPA